MSHDGMFAAPAHVAAPMRKLWLAYSCELIPICLSKFRVSEVKLFLVRGCQIVAGKGGPQCGG